MTTKSFIQLLSLVAAGGLIGVWHIAPPAADFSLGTIGVLLLLALTAELTGFLLPRGGTGSIAFIPYMTALVLVPNFSALLAIGGATAITQLAKRPGGLNVLFNSSQLLSSSPPAL